MKIAKKLLIGVTAVACAFVFASCGSEQQAEKPETDNGENQTTQTLAEKQIARAKQTYESFYNKEGGLFSAQPSAQSSVKATAQKAGVALAEDNATAQTITFNDVRQALDKYSMGLVNNIKNIFNSYVADIFSYSQVQTSIIEQFGESSLTDVYALTYDKVEWNSDTTGNANWINQTKLLSAAFAGSDLDSGNVYCTQAHIISNALVLANVEYYYNSDGDMGVTTVNYHSDGKFEYHYCSAGTYEILQANGTYDPDGNITLTSFLFTNQNGKRTTGYDQADIQLFNSYVQSEVARIDGKIEDLQKQNQREITLDGNENEAGEHIGVCSVNFDFSKLAKMIIK